MSPFFAAPLANEAAKQGLLNLIPLLRPEPAPVLPREKPAWHGEIIPPGPAGQMAGFARARDFRVDIGKGEVDLVIRIEGPGGSPGARVRQPDNLEIRVGSDNTGRFRSGPGGIIPGGI